MTFAGVAQRRLHVLCKHAASAHGGSSPSAGSNFNDTHSNYKSLVLVVRFHRPRRFGVSVCAK